MGTLQLVKTDATAATMFATSTFTGVRIMNVVAAPKATGRVAFVVEARRTKASAPSKGGTKVAKFGSTAPPDLYPEFGTYPGGGESPIIPFGNEKNAEREIIHGRWAQLGVTGAWAAENGTGIPWFTAGTLCTPDDCTAVADKFPGAVSPLAPEGSGYPSFWNVLIIETIWLAVPKRTELAWLTRSLTNSPSGTSPRVADSTRCP